jgi:protein ImuA
MRFISCHNGQLQQLAEVGLKTSSERTFRTGLELVDELAPGGGLVRGAVHEVLSEKAHGQARFFAAMLARSVTKRDAAGSEAVTQSNLHRFTASPLHRVTFSPPIIWVDPKGELYPPALLELGIDLSNVYILHPKSIADENWAIAECLRCKGVGVVIAAPQRLTRIEARRFQLAAETGGSVAILLRHTGVGSNIYAAATRWLVAPAPGERTVQRWKVQLVHGHGGRIGQSVLLEYCRETREVRAVREVEKLADRPLEAQAPARARARARASA